MAKYANKNAKKKKLPIMHKKPKIADYAKKYAKHTKLNPPLLAIIFDSLINVHYNKFKS